MCRFAAYVGPEAPLSTLLYEPPRSLEIQSYRPGEMVSGHVNVDGTGVAWWEDGEDAPLRYVSERPPWSDANLPRLAARLRGAPILAAVRSQTPGMPAGPSAAHPFGVERWAGAHNGFIEGFGRRAAALLGRVDEVLHRHVDTLSDSLLLFLVAVGALRRGATRPEALRQSATAALEVYGEEGVVSLNVIVADAEGVTALRAARGVAANSLYVLEDGARWPGARLIASEPLDEDGGWTGVGDDELVSITADGIEREPAGL